MAIPNTKRYRITDPDSGRSATIIAVLPKGVDVNAYLQDAAKRYDWKGHEEAAQKQFKIRVGQQKQKRAK
jgi:predicted DCC family thiol-disulfide oxidoreductase YuxK